MRSSRRLSGTGSRDQGAGDSTWWCRLLNLEGNPSPGDAADALAAAHLSCAINIRAIGESRSTRHALARRVLSMIGSIARSPRLVKQAPIAPGGVRRRGLRTGNADVDVPRYCPQSATRSFLLTHLAVRDDAHVAVRLLPRWTKSSCFAQSAQGLSGVGAKIASGHSLRHERRGSFARCVRARRHRESGEDCPACRSRRRRSV